MVRSMVILQLLLVLLYANTNEPRVEKAYFAGGCFWGVEYHLEKLEGVQSVISGYMGGHTPNPTYRDVLRHTTGHYESVEVTFDPKRVSYEKIARLFFEIHDPTQRNGQGPDIGAQYRSALFYVNEEQRRTAEKLIALLRAKGYDVVTHVLPYAPFYQAEVYHQDYYEKHHKEPYCHTYTKRF